MTLLQVGNWFVIELSTESFKTIRNASVNSSKIIELTYKFLLYNNNTNTTSAVDFKNLPNFTVTINWTGEDISFNQIINNALGKCTEYTTAIKVNASNHCKGEDNEYIRLNATSEDTIKLTVTKTLNTTNDLNSQQLTYTITITNNVPSTATNVTVTEILYPILILVSNNTIYGTYDGSVWDIGSINVGETVNMTLVVKINGSCIINNTVVVNTPDQNNTGDTTTNDTNVTSSINFSIVKVANVSSVLNGQTVEYTITVTNNGFDNATSVIVSDILDSRLVYIGSNTTQGIYDPITGLWNIDNINVDSTVTLTIVVRANGSENIENIADITPNQTNTANNSTNTTIFVPSSAPNKIITNSTLIVPANVAVSKTINIAAIATDEYETP
ncbi:hypothetical protein ALNOE001_04060 [Candidatus Methanobinarius endosymbioticus]|uniref:DUF11 domain-containing protein n=1 Tax=Candidatus Methanobinarius endosymbioticus TaxID=2006182 RepID=A0A366MF95_9EURY|nr:hypothetical protein ALNOE001_04060 [Candidatus Methanobinarius endosymbioticus]